MNHMDGDRGKIRAHRPAADRVLTLRAEPPSGVSSLRVSPALRGALSDYGPAIFMILVFAGAILI